jgi:lipopolysaccharide/colanic/teichoic acid biosynthesis glycosyltransferase
MQRAFNLVAAAASLLLLSPLLAIIALAIRWDDNGPVFYSQPRIGRGLQVFSLIKFRTMAIHADRAGLLTTANDPRITRVGRTLRKYKLDELPQLWNVLKGEMQLVGPRPEVAPYVARFREQYELLLREPPGITDPASLAYRHEERVLGSGDIENLYTSKILPDKLRLSLEYQQRRSLASDLAIILNTFLRLAD